MQPTRIKTIAAYHELMQLQSPEHPLVSVISFESIKHVQGGKSINLLMDYYSIALKKNFNARMKYGQQEYDFDKGIMTFMAPGQLLSIEANNNEELIHTGWLLLIHPDFLWNTALVKKIRQYEFFGYTVHEALHLSDKEENIVGGIMRNIEQEYRSNIDKFSQDVIIAQIELLLTYAERFYSRQFITRKIANHQVLDRLEKVLADYFNTGSLMEKGLPTVKDIAALLNMSPNYLTSLLKMLTGQSTQQHIHEKLIEKAKEKLSTTQLSISEIAYELGFEHAQSFAKLFKSKTNQSPIEFRQSFN